MPNVLRGALIALALMLSLGALSAHAAPVALPTWDRARADDRTFIVSVADARSHYATIGARKRMLRTRQVQSIDVRAGMRGMGGIVRRSWVLNGKDLLVGRSRPFPLAKGTTTVRYQILQRAYTERIWDHQFDRYINVCINGGVRTWASGGRLYCEVSHAGRVRVTQRTRIRNLPRPHLIKGEDLGALRPVCTIGEFDIDYVGLGTTGVVECQDRIDLRDSMDDLVRRRIRTTVRIPRLSGASRVVSAVIANPARGQRGPGWVSSDRACAFGEGIIQVGESRTSDRLFDTRTERCVADAGGHASLATEDAPLPPPTVRVTSITAGTFSGSFQIGVEVTNHYRSGCALFLLARGADGVDRLITSTYVGPGATVNASGAWSGGASNSTPTTTASVRSISGALC